MNEVLQTLIDCWMFDVWVFTQWWLYVFIVPVVLYLPFFFVKWAVLTAPAWLPPAMVASSFKGFMIKLSR